MKKQANFRFVIPVKMGIQLNHLSDWMPAFAGMTV